METTKTFLVVSGSRKEASKDIRAVRKGETGNSDEDRDVERVSTLQLKDEGHALPKGLGCVEGERSKEGIIESERETLRGTTGEEVSESETTQLASEIAPDYTIYSSTILYIYYIFEVRFRETPFPEEATLAGARGTG